MDACLGFHGQALSSGDTEQDRIGTNEDGLGLPGCQIVIAPRKRACELYCIVGAQGMCTTECGGTGKNSTINLHDDIPAAHLLLKPRNEPISVSKAQAWWRLTYHTTKANDNLDECQFGDNDDMTLAWAT